MGCEVESEEGGSHLPDLTFKFPEYLHHAYPGLTVRKAV